MAGVGRYNRYVTLSRSPQTTGDSDGFFEDLSPPDWWCLIQPNGASSERTTEHAVEGRYRPDITIDTRIVYEDPTKPTGKTTRSLYVRSVVNVNEANQTMRLVAEEVEP